MRVRRTVRFRATGSGLSAFMSAVKNSPAVCLSQKCSAGEYTGVVLNSDFGIIEKLAAEKGISLSVTQCGGGMYRVYKYRMRYGIAAGVVFTVLFVLFMSVFITEIEINGNVITGDDEILSVLGECGISHGSYIPEIDFTSAEYMLESRINCIAWAAVRSRGGKVTVDIKEDDGKSGSVKSRLPCNIVSDHDALIVSVLPFRGQCMVKEGSAVAEGDLLISGIMTNDMYSFVSAHASGEIIGEYKEKQKFVRYFENTEKKYTDTVFRKVICFFGFRIPLGLSPVRNCMADKSENTERYEITGHKLPLEMITEKYDIYELENVTETEEEAEMNVQAQIMMFEKNFLSDKVITDRKLEKNIYEDRVEYDSEYTVRGKIGTEKMIFPGKEEEDHE